VTPRGIIIHTVGVPGDTTAGAIRRYHLSLGWADIGYHRVVRKSGVVEDGRALWRAGSHTKGANDTWGICVTGDGDREPWTQPQWAAVAKLCAEWCRAKGWGPEVVRGHREAPAYFGADPTGKSCPGRLVDMDLVRSAVELTMAVGGKHV